jgi:PAS domain S-box-containing protein
MNKMDQSNPRISRGRPYKINPKKITVLIFGLIFFMITTAGTMVNVKALFVQNTGTCTQYSVTRACFIDLNPDFRKTSTISRRAQPASLKDIIINDYYPYHFINQLRQPDDFNIGQADVPMSTILTYLGGGALFGVAIAAVLLAWSVSLKKQVGQRTMHLKEEMHEREQAEVALRESEARFRSLFDDSPICLWEEDFSAVKQGLDELRAGGVTDFNVYFVRQPEAVAQYAALVKVVDVNKATLALYGAASKEDMVKNLAAILSEEGYGQFRNELVQIASGATHFEIEQTNQTLDGRRKIVNLNWAVIPGHESDLSRIIVSLVDITERKQTEEALRTSDRYYSSLFNNMLHGIAYCQMLYENDVPRDFIYLDVNQEFEKITGLKNVIGKKVTELIPGIRESDPKLFEIYGRVAMTGSPEVFKTYIEGLRDWYSISISSPRQSYFVAVFDVITASKLAEENHKKSEQQFRTLFEQAAVGVAVTDAHSGEFLKINQRFCEILGYSAEEMKGVPFKTLTYPDDVQISLEKMQLLLSGAIRKFLLEKRYIKKDGSCVWVNINAAAMWEPGEDPTSYVTIVQDITERKQAGEQIASLVERFDLASRAAHLGVWDWDIVNNHLVWDDYMYELYGVKKENFAGAYEAWLDGIHPDDRKNNDEISQQAQRGEREYDPEFRVLWPNGTVHWLKAYGHITRGADGKPLRMIGVNYDITERKRTEEALRESEEKLRLFIEFAPASLAMFDREMIYQAVSQRWITDNHLEGQEILEKSHYVILPGITEEWKEVHRRGMTGEVVTCEEDKFVRLDGSIQWLKWEVRPWFKDDRTVRGIIIFFEDITEYKQVEEKLNANHIELQRLLAEADESRQVLLNVVEDQKIAEEKLSQLNIELEQRVRERTTELEAANQELEAFSYSVSHDLRAPLRGIDGWSSVLMDDYKDQLDEKGRQSLGRVRSETQRMGQLIDDMLRLSRVTRAEMKRGPVNLSELALSIAARLQEETPQQNARFIIQTGLDDLGDPNLLEIMLTNLLSNAWKFSGKHPQPVIEFGKSLINGKPAYFVRDNGAGFDMAYAKNLFGAFQRMHKQSDFPGTGIGLATVQRIIHRHGGKVWAEASKNAGATFYFTLQESA